MTKQAGSNHARTGVAGLWLPAVLGGFLLSGVFPMVEVKSGEVPTRPVEERVAIDETGKSFLLLPSGRPFRFRGVNYDHDRRGRLLEEYWDEESRTVVEDLEEIRELGARVVRIHLQVAAFLEGPDQFRERSLERLDWLLEHCRKLGLHVILTGLGCYHEHPDWYRDLGESARWQVQAKFWEGVARVTRDRPEVFALDLMNEPILPGPGRIEKEWLTGELGGKHFVQRISLDLAGRKREEVARAWVETLVLAIRKHDVRHLVTVGVIPWARVFRGARPLFYSPTVHEKLDFVSVHFYPEKDKLESDLEALSVYDIGKPLVVEEIFPLRGSIEDVELFLEGAGKRVDGWVSFYWGMTIEELEKLEKPSVAQVLQARWLRVFFSKPKG